MDDEKLIEAVRGYECLYNLQHPKYVDSKYKDILWREIAHNLNQPASVCKSRWQNIRDSFRKFWTRQQMTKSGQAADGGRRRTNKFERFLGFLVPHLVERDPLSTVRGIPKLISQGPMSTTMIATLSTSGAESAEDESNADEEDAWNQPSTSGSERTREPLYDAGNGDDDELRHSRESNAGGEDRQPPRKRRKKSSEAIYEQIMRNLRETKLMLRGSPDKADSDIDHLCRSVAAAAKLLTPKRRRKAKKLIYKCAEQIDDLLGETDEHQP